MRVQRRPCGWVGVLAAGLMGALVSAAAVADTVRDTQPVTASVINSCRITSIDGLLFGQAYNPVSTASSQSLVERNGNITLRCTQGASGWVGMDQGQNAQTSSTCDQPNRRLYSTGTRAFLSYRLVYQADGSRETWGCGVANGPTFSSPSSGSDITVPAIAQIVGGQDVAPGDYDDQVIISINF